MVQFLFGDKGVPGQRRQPCGLASAVPSVGNRPGCLGWARPSVPSLPPTSPQPPSIFPPASLQPPPTSPNLPLASPNLPQPPPTSLQPPPSLPPASPSLPAASLQLHSSSPLHTDPLFSGPGSVMANPTFWFLGLELISFAGWLPPELGRWASWRTCPGGTSCLDGGGQCKLGRGERSPVSCCLGPQLVMSCIGLGLAAMNSKGVQGGGPEAAWEGGGTPLRVPWPGTQVQALEEPWPRRGEHPGCTPVPSVWWPRGASRPRLPAGWSVVTTYPTQCYVFPALFR